MIEKSDLQAIVADVANKHGLTPANIYGWSKKARIVRAREESIRRMKAEFDMSNRAIARFFGMDASSVWAVFNRPKKRSLAAAQYHRAAQGARA